MTSSSAPTRPLSDFKYFDRLDGLLAPLRPAGTDHDTAGNRRLYFTNTPSSCRCTTSIRPSPASASSPPWSSERDEFPSPRGTDANPHRRVRDRRRPPSATSALPARTAPEGDGHFPAEAAVGLARLRAGGARAVLRGGKTGLERRIGEALAELPEGNELRDLAADIAPHPTHLDYADRLAAGRSIGCGRVGGDRAVGDAAAEGDGSAAEVGDDGDGRLQGEAVGVGRVLDGEG